MADVFGADRPRIRVPAGSSAAYAAMAPFMGLAAAISTPAHAEDEDEMKAAPAKSEDDEDSKKAKKAKTKGKRKDDEGDDEDRDPEDDDAEDDDEDEMRGTSVPAGARRRERARIRAIVNSGAAKANPVLAMQIALHSSLTRQEAVAILRAAPPAAAVAAASGGLAGRMAGQPQPRASFAPEHAANPAQAAASSWDRAAAKAGIARR